MLDCRWILNLFAEVNPKNLNYLFYNILHIHYKISSFLFVKISGILIQKNEFVIPIISLILKY